MMNRADSESVESSGEERVSKESSIEPSGEESIKQIIWTREKIDSSITKICKETEELILQLTTFSDQNRRDLDSKDFKDTLNNLGRKYFALKGAPLAVRVKARRNIVETIISSKFLQTFVKLFTLSLNQGLSCRFRGENGKLSSKLLTPAKNLLLFAFNFSDASEKFGIELCKYDEFLGSVVRILNELRHDCLQETLEKNTVAFVRYAISCGYNLIMYDVSENVRRIHDCGMTQAIKPFLNFEKNKAIMVSALLFYVYAVTEEEAKELLSQKYAINFLINSLSKALTDRYKRCKGYSSVELARGLERLAKNDTNKRQLVEQGILPVLKWMITSNALVERELAYLILWTLAFDDGNRDQLSEEVGEAVRMVSTDIEYKMKEDDMEEDVAEMRKRIEKARQGVLWVLAESKRSTLQAEGFVPPAPALGLPLRGKDLLYPRVRPSPRDGPRMAVACESALDSRNRSLEAKKTSGRRKRRPEMQSSAKRGLLADELVGEAKHIMISYCWSNKDIVRKIHEELKKRYRVSVWIDFEDMAINPLDAMANAVEHASCIVLCYSKKYKDSQNCRSEAEYAYRLKKSMIPVLVEPKYHADGWLGIMLGTKLYYDFSGKYSFDQKFEELADALKDWLNTRYSSNTNNEVVGVLSPSQEEKHESIVPVPLEEVKHEPCELCEVKTTQKMYAYHTKKQDVKDKPIAEPADEDQKKPADLSSSTASLASWTSEDVQRWCREKALNSSAMSGLLGRNLRFLKDLRKESPEYFYRLIETKLQLSSIDEITLFVNALDTL